VKGPRARLIAVAFVVALVFSLFSFRLVHLQVVKHEEYTRLAVRKHVERQVMHANRGAILDARGEVLAENVPVKTVVADASHITDLSEVARIVSEELALPRREVEEKLATGKRYLILKRRVPDEVALRLRTRLGEGKLAGIYYEHDSDRLYPNGRMLCHVIGFINREYAGVQGVEKTMDEYLRGEDGYRYIERDRTGKELVPYRGQEKQSQDGGDVRLTVDLAVQQIVEEELDAAMKEYRPKSAVAVLMRPATGEIVAMASRPAFDLNALEEARPEELKNRAVIDMVEPGSTFKIVTLGGALNERLVTLNTTVFCENGRFAYGGKVLRDHHPYGSLTAKEVLVKSSNIGSAKLAMQLGDQRLYDYIRRFGFGEPTGVQVPGEIGGMLHPVHRWSKISITRIPMGHEVCVTPVQLATAMGAVANGGRLMMPQIVKSVADGRGRRTLAFPPVAVRQAISPETARLLGRALAEVVGEKGTARLAAVPGYSVAGKTGTAQKVDPNGGYTPGKYVVSFLGYLPVEKPQLVGLVMLDDAVTKPGMNYGDSWPPPFLPRSPSAPCGPWTSSRICRCCCRARPWRPPGRAVAFRLPAPFPWFTPRKGSRSRTDRMQLLPHPPIRVGPARRRVARPRDHGDLPRLARRGVGRALCRAAGRADRRASSCGTGGRARRGGGALRGGGPVRARHARGGRRHPARPPAHCRGVSRISFPPAEGERGDGDQR
jgi:cell division protein FtsI/penicillin-binding protein 2